MTCQVFSFSEVFLAYLWAQPQYRWTDLLNSDSWDHRGSGRRVDRLEVDDWLASFLELCGYEKEHLPGASERAALRQLRSAMARLVSVIVAKAEPGRKEIETLNRYLRLADARPQVELVAGSFEIREARSRKGVDQVIGDLARSLAETLARGELERIKVCANPDCHWVMYDESRNRSRRWCETSACGNLVKVRQFRERQAHPETTTREAPGVLGEDEDETQPAQPQDDWRFY